MNIKLNFKETLYINPTLESLNEPLELFENFLKNFEILEKERMQWKLCLMEILSNAIHHGCDGKKDVQIEIKWEYRPEEIRVEVTDKGPGPYAGYIESPNLPQELLAKSGRGLFIVNSFIDVWLHKKSTDGYEQTLVKFLK